MKIEDAFIQTTPIKPKCPKSKRLILVLLLKCCFLFLQADGIIKIHYNDRIRSFNLSYHFSWNSMRCHECITNMCKVTLAIVLHLQCFMACSLVFVPISKYYLYCMTNRSLKADLNFASYGDFLFLSIGYCLYATDYTEHIIGIAFLKEHSKHCI